MGKCSLYTREKGLSSLALTWGKLQSKNFGVRFSARHFLFLYLFIL